MELNIKYFFFTALLFAPITGLASDESAFLCKPFIDFVRSSTGSANSKVRLTTDWSEFSKSCNYFGEAAAEEFCTVLLKNTSTEFMRINLSNILNCASADLKFENAYIDNLTGSVTVFDLPRLPADYGVTISFSINQENVHDYMEIEGFYDVLDQ